MLGTSHPQAAGFSGEFLTVLTYAKRATWRRVVTELCIKARYREIKISTKGYFDTAPTQHEIHKRAFRVASAFAAPRAIRITIRYQVLRMKPWHFGAASGIVMCYARLGKAEEANRCAANAMPQPGTPAREAWVQRMMQTVHATSWPSLRISRTDKCVSRPFRPLGPKVIETASANVSMPFTTHTVYCTIN